MEGPYYKYNTQIGEIPLGFDSNPDHSSIRATVRFGPNYTARHCMGISSTDYFECEIANVF